ncbi:type 1 fimbrial protein [Citrobacter portucalensis]|uniref:fimbrial protein n=1 Tax=Citrobacter portucalensis TaxID=1639133 RepID=UPI0015EAAF9A|nr:fimbrial protein [Citrobacter portucalensis]MBA8419098.1 type 1 fimbrial protein [Citrobacter freundii]MDE9612362.1 type 1 fimbrial protein [Citrobacter portucalensis]QMM95797.1 type 1 fimbrial protein [Citrobacter freundii]WFZ22810.1 type 1 fimbrial protein [Citrobacter portucalensis]
MTKVSISRIVICLLLYITIPSYAALGEAPITLYGTLTAQGCDVSPESANQNIRIGDFSVSDYKTAGTVSPAADLYITITGCTATPYAQVYFSGESDDNEPELLKLSGDTQNGNTAVGIAVQILDGNTLAEIPLNQQSSTWTQVSTKSDTQYHYKLRYKSTRADVKSGNAAAVLYFDVIYK